MVLRSPTKHVRLPHNPQSVIDVLRWRALAQPDTIGFTFLPDGEHDEERLTYGELDRRAKAIADELVAAGAAGSRALMVYDSGFDYIAAIYGCLYAGVTAVPVYPPDPYRVDRTLPRLCSIVADAGATWLLATEATLDWARPLFRNVPGLTSSLATDIVAKSGSRIRENSEEAESSRAAILQYTSGSTGAPRGVTITHANLLANLRTIDATFDRDDNVIVLWLPAYHDMGLIGGVFQPVYSGRPLVLMSPVSFMQRPVRWLNAISRYRGTITAAPNFAYDLCVRKVTAEDRAALDLSCVMAALNGAEMVRPETLDRFSQTFAECGFRREAFYPCYGLAEATLMVAGGAVDQPPVVRSFDATALEEKRAVKADESDSHARTLVGCGHAALGQRIVIADPEAGVALDDRCVGEIWVAGESVGQGYWNRPDESVATFQANLADGDGPFLRTGDLGFLDGGELFFVGRQKELIIVQGRNHYPDDIEETAWRCHPLLKADGSAAFSIEIGGEERLAIVQEVLRPRKAEPDALIGMIRSHVAEVHGVTPAAVALIPAGTLPKTSSGKKQRRSCRDQLLGGSLPTIAQWRDDGPQRGERGLAGAPTTYTEKKLAAVWTDVLGQEVADVHANFFDLGGQSLLAAQLAARIQEEFAIELSLRTLFSNPTLAGLAGWLDGAESRGSDSLPPVTRVDRSQPLPLSSLQEQLWFLEQLEREPRYNLTASIRLQGPLDVDALKRALTTITARHDALRTTFQAIDGMPRQIVATEANVALILPDASPSAVASKIHLATGPLLDARIERFADNDHRLLVTAHHLICDGWSLAIFLRELTALYTAEVAGEKADLGEAIWQYPDFAAWQRSCLSTATVGKQLDFWKQQLAGIEPVRLITDYSRSGDSKYHGAATQWSIEKSTADALNELAQGEGATLYMVLLAAFQTLLARYARCEDVCVGSPVAYRPRREFEASIGYFVNTLALRTDLSGEPTFRRLLARVRETVLDALANRDTPLSAVVDAVAPRREAGRSPLFDVMFVFENLPWHGTQTADLSLGEIQIDHSRIGNFDVGLVIEEQSTGLKASLVYNAELFDAGTIEHMAGAFRRLLAEIATNADRPVTRLPLVDESELTGKAEPHNANGYAADHDDPRVDVLITRRSQATPLATAIVGPRESVTYRDLEGRANQLAHYLKDLGVGSDVPVAIFLDRSAELVIAMLAVMKAGGAYVPFDPNEAHGRLATMLADTRPRAIITSSALAKRLPPHEAEEVVVDRDWSDIARQPTTALPEDGLPRPSRSEEQRIDGLGSPSSDDRAYIIYTSGSTGRPKGVEVTHASLSNFVKAIADQYDLTVRDRVLQLISPAFDVTVEEIFPTLVRGATLVLGPCTAELTGRAILDVCRRERVTVAHIPPQLWQQCLRDWEPADESLFDHWRVLVIGGEAPPADALNRWLTLARGRVRTLHEFGLTETTVTNFVYELASDLAAWPARRKLPVGRPIAGSRVYVLDAHQQSVPVGAPGELYIGGPCVARGYHASPEVTSERFIELATSDKPGSSATSRFFRTGDLARWLPDGNLEFLGRIDEQIKLRGLRIEPGEIEQVIMRHPEVKEAAVVARDESPGRRRLVAYLVPSNGHVPNREELHAWLRGKLPESMVPSAVMQIDRLPLNRSHKLDRDALPVPPVDDHRSDYVAPRNEVERILADVWRQVLKVARVGIHDNFFELGGDSILTIQVIARAREAGLRFMPRQMFEGQTIAELAAVEGIESTPTAEQGLVEGAVPLTPIQHWFLSDDVVDPQHFNQAVLLSVESSLDSRYLPDVLDRLAVQHDALRLRFQRSPGGWRQWHGEVEGAWPLTTFDFSHMPATERTFAVTAAATELQSSLDLEHGPVARAAWFDLAEGQKRLLLIAHHLVVDAVSWNMLLQDLATVWCQLQASESPMLPDKTSSFKVWAQRLADYANSVDARNELAYWSALAQHQPASLPRDSQLDHDNTFGESAVVNSIWDASGAGNLLQQANVPYRTQTHELLLAALAQTLANWARSEVFVDVEGHGRSTLFDDIDLSRTVGWFTAWHPFLLSTGQLAPGTSLRQTKDVLRSVPNEGLGYGVLRFLSSDAAIRSAMAALPRAEVSFNYLGRIDDLVPGTALKPATEPIGPCSSPRGRRHHLVEINCYLLDSRLHIDWTFSRRVHHRKTIEKLAADFLARLNELVFHCLSPEAGGYTPSDFPMAQMTESELDKLAGLLGD